MQTITPPSSLNGTHLRTFEKIFAHPVSHNLAWHDVLTLFTRLGEIMIEPNGNLKVTRNGHVLMLSAPATKEVDNIEALIKLRHFLVESETVRIDSTATVPHLLVVINHCRARLFRTEMKGAVPQVILPYEPDETYRRAHDDRDFFSGKAKPAPVAFFESLAKALKNADKILLCGAGTGTSSEMEQLILWLEKHHPALARRVTGAFTIDEHHLTEGQLLAKAREFYARPGVLA